MGSVTDVRNIPKDRIVSGTAETTRAPRTRNGTKLRDVLMSDKPNLSYSDFHHELTRNSDSAFPKYVVSQRSEKSNLKQEELVRYMSTLPSYLEKGKNYQEKALNVGVLDWKHLEKWRYSRKQTPSKQNSPSSSNTSLFSTDGSSTHSKKGQSFSPARQRLQRPSLQSPVEVSPEGHLQDDKSSLRRRHSFSPVFVPRSHLQKVFAGGVLPLEIEVFGRSTQKFSDSTACTGNYFSRQHKVFGGVPFHERKGYDLNSVSETGRKFIPDKYDATATWTGKKLQNLESTKESGRLQETKLHAADRGCSEKDKSGSAIMASDPMEHSGYNFAGSTTITSNDRLSVEPSEKFLLARNNLESRRLSSNDIHNQLEPTVVCFRHETGIENSSQASHISVQSTSKIPQSPSSNNARSFPARMFSSPARSRHTPEKKPISEVWRETAAKPSGEFDTRKTSEPILKARNPSPIRRLSTAMGKMIKNSGSRENSPLRRSSAKDCIAKSGSEAADYSSFIDNPSSDKLSSNNSRGRSSPLRRLLDPLLKPRVSNCSETSDKHPSSVIGTMKPRNKPSDSRPGHSGEGNLSAAKNGSSTLQALLQVSFKNGLPLFTFAIDNESNILAATVRKSSAPGKGRNSWIYMFFAIREVKRKSGSWLNNEGKGGNNSYVPNVVAQMKVSDSSSSSSIDNENTDDLVCREFDLFAVDVGQGDEYSTDFHPTNEFAAIIAKFPRTNTGNSTKDNDSTCYWLDLSLGSLRQNSQMNLSTTVVLPGGLHAEPSTGQISRLAQRWRSGGLCDCGGWDLGCQLRVYTDKKENETIFDSSEICPMKDKLQLFSQVGQDNQPVLSLAPFKERIYSVEFSSSFSLLQAFAVSVSFLDCRRTPELSELNNVPERVTSEVPIFEVPNRSQIPNQAVVPGRYVSYPPHSPFGRV